MFAGGAALLRSWVLASVCCACYGAARGRRSCGERRAVRAGQARRMASAARSGGARSCAERCVCTSAPLSGALRGAESRRFFWFVRRLLQCLLGDLASPNGALLREGTVCAQPGGVHYLRLRPARALAEQRMCACHGPWRSQTPVMEPTCVICYQHWHLVLFHCPLPSRTCPAILATRRCE